MRIYADTSWWLACKCRRDVHHRRAIMLFDDEPEAQVVWTPWHRVEVFNAFRQTERAGLVAPGESRQLLRLLEQEVRLGLNITIAYFTFGKTVRILRWHV